MTRLECFASLAMTMTFLAGCNRDEGPPAPTAEESARLDEAEAMLNGLNEEGPAPEDADPSNLSD